jgi:hypothetical protein
MAVENTKLLCWDAMATDQNIIRDFDVRYQEAYYAWDPFFPEAERDLRFYLGDQWDEQEKRQLFQEGRNTFVFNRVRRNINMVTGYQRKHRLSSVVTPVENSDQKTSDQLSQLLLYAMNYAEGYQMVSDCFGGALKTGWNLASLWVDYRDDPVSGDIKFNRETYNSFILDPYLTKLDLSDCGYIMRRKYLSVEHTASLLPEFKREVYDLFDYGWERDDKFTWLPYQRQPNGEQLMAYNEMYEQKWKNVPTLVDMETGEMIEFDVNDDIIRAFMQRYPQLRVVDRPKRYIEKHIIINDQAIKTEINPNGLDEYPFVPFTAIWEPESDQWGLKVQSLIRCMRDPQRESNKRRSQMIDLLDSQINSGWIANENSVINPRSLFQSSQGKVIWRREDAPPGAIEKIPPAQIPPSMFQLQELFDRDMMEIAGINDAAFGQTENAGESGVMMMLRQSSAIVNLQELFDNLRVSQKHLSKKVLKLIQKWSPEKVERIINEDPTQEFYEKEFTKYDIEVGEGILTDTQKQMYFRQLVDLKQLGAPVTGEMLAKAAPIQGKTEYIEELAALEKQQGQQAQQQQQIQEQLLDSQRQMSQAKAISDIALSKERFTRAVANMGLEDERASAAVENRADAALSRTRAMKELESMSDDRLVKYLGIIRSMEEMNRQSEEQVKEDDVNISARVNEPQQTVPEVGSLLQELPQQQQVEVPNA